MENQKQQGNDVKIDVYARSDAGWIALAIMILAILTWGDPDLLDVLQEFCRRYMDKGA